MGAQHIARWDLDKTYLRTEFDTLRDLVRTALERPEEKETNPGAATLLRELQRAGTRVHILSGSPEQMRKRLEDKLRLDGILWDSFTLKPNLRNVLRLRFRALRDQLGYKLPALLEARGRVEAEEGPLPSETLFGDDAEADAFVYSLYADLLSGRVSDRVLAVVLERGLVYEDTRKGALLALSQCKIEPVVERIFIHLERQSPPDDFEVYGGRVIPFYNYLQASFVLLEAGRLDAVGVLKVADELARVHRFDGDALAKSYEEVAARGHLRGTHVDDLLNADSALRARPELARLLSKLPELASRAQEVVPAEQAETIDYEALVVKHNPRNKQKRR